MSRARPGRTAYEGVFALLYNPAMALAERAGMRELRRDTLSTASGDVLEIGAGTGLNVALYPAVGSLTLIDPMPAMAARLRETTGNHVVVEAGAEELPFEDASFDTVVSTLVLCTVPDVDRSLAEIRRVLRPGGRLLLLEHVRSSNPRTTRWQDRLVRPVSAIALGCQCNRDTAASLDRAGFDTSRLRDGTWKRMPPVVRQLLVGPATASP